MPWLISIVKDATLEAEWVLTADKRAANQKTNSQQTSWRRRWLTGLNNFTGMWRLNEIKGWHRLVWKWHWEVDDTNQESTWDVGIRTKQTGAVTKCLRWQKLKISIDSHSDWKRSHKDVGHVGVCCHHMDCLVMMFVSLLFGLRKSFPPTSSPSWRFKDLLSSWCNNKIDKNEDFWGKLSGWFV